MLVRNLARERLVQEFDRAEVLWRLQDIVREAWCEVLGVSSPSKFPDAYRALLSAIQGSARFKDPDNPITGLDEDLNLILVERVGAEFPFNILTEEEIVSVGTNMIVTGHELRAILDPLDGSINLLKGIEHFCTAIAVRDHEKTLIGMVYDPIRNVFFHSIGGGRSFRNSQEVSVNTQSFDNGLLLVSDGSSDRVLGKKLIEAIRAHGIRFQVLGVAQLDLCGVAEGKAIGYLKTKAPEWDSLAGMFIVENAGGKCTVIGENYIVACNGVSSVHERLVEIMGEVTRL